jgi:hypothetical protein
VVGGEYSLDPPRTASPHLDYCRHTKAGPSWQGGGCARLGWLGPPPPSLSCLFAGPRSAWVGGLARLWSWVWASLLLWLFCALQKAHLCFCFTCSRLMFLQSYHFYWYKWKQVNSTCICVYECIFSSFLELCWRYKYIDNDHQGPDV